MSLSLPRLGGPAPRAAVPPPPPPATLAAAGVPERLLLDLLLKHVERRALERPGEMAAALALPVRLIEPLLMRGREEKLIEPLGQPGARIAAEMRYGLTDRGRARALEALARSGWVGPAPVGLSDFTDQAVRQSIRAERLTRARLTDALVGLVLPPGLIDALGPAANSGSAILLYGPPGNGKTSIAAALAQAFEDRIYLPHALAVEGEIVQLFDPGLHVRLADTEDGESGLRQSLAHDPRYVPCRRPAVVAGGELTLAALDLSPATLPGVGIAPIQLKAAGGVLILDDFGRQAEPAQRLTNRLIVPLERGVDFLTLPSGRRVEVPYDALTVFSTNADPGTLLDAAALRRFRHKIRVPSPDRESYVRILARAAERAGLGLDDETLAFLLIDLYGAAPGLGFEAFHPRFLIDQVLAIAAFEGVPPRLAPDTLSRAWANLIVER